MADKIMGINLQEYNVIIENDLDIGDTIRVNHNDCPAGEDIRRRLYITRPQADPGVVVGYCHNCQEGGYLHTGGHDSYRKNRHDKMPVDQRDVVSERVDAPPGMLDKILDWPLLARAWAYQSKLNNDLIHAYGIQYDPSSDRVYLPQYHWHKISEGSTPYKWTHGDLNGYQLRNVDPRSTKAKYYTITAKDEPGFSIMGSSKNTNPITRSTGAIIVEDLCSGIAVVHAMSGGSTDFHVLVNYGVKVNLQTMHCASKFDSVIVWLDNDNKHVKTQADDMARTISMINSKCKVEVVTGASDPKHYGPSTIAEIIGRHHGLH